MATEDATRRGATDTTARAARAGYAICGTARSGSSWFAGALDSTGALGHPADAFNTLYQRRVLGAHYPADRAEQIRLVLTEGATENGIYGVKVFPIHLFRMGQQIGWTRHLPNLRFNHWRRRDLLDQALSRHSALQTLQWRSTLEPLGDAVYDGRATMEALIWAAVQDALGGVLRPQRYRAAASGLRGRDGRPAGRGRRRADPDGARSQAAGRLEPDRARDPT